MDLMRSVPRYFLPLVRHGTRRKLLNVLQIEAELYGQKKCLRGYPYFYLIDICNRCNLTCPLCNVGANKFNRTQGMINLEEYRAIFEKIKDYALIISLTNLGEPFLNKDIHEIVSHTQSNNISTTVSSNFNWPTFVDPKDIVRSGLEYIVASIDGVSQESYEKYRVGGVFSEVVENLKSLIDAKKVSNSKTPFIEWQFIVFKHNEKEIERAVELAKEWRVDLLRFFSPAISFGYMHDKSVSKKWLPGNPTYRECDPELMKKRGYLYKRPCFYLFRSMTIDKGGAVTCCCAASEKEHEFGNILQQSLSEIWNSRYYQSARTLFGERQNTDDRVRVLCDDCLWFRKARSY